MATHSEVQGQAKAAGSVGTLRVRSGTAARLAGLPVSTLRVWERRYAVVKPEKTDGGQRVYSQHDVARLRFLRRLTHAGHAIGTIATLELESLRALAEDEPPVPVLGIGAVLDAVVVGRSAAHVLESVPGCLVRDVHEDLAQAESASGATQDGVSLLVVRLSSLQPSVVDRVLSLGGAIRASAVFVVYAFGTEASASALRAAGVTVRREPLVERDLAHWVMRVRQALPTAPVERGWQGAPRRFSDEMLSRLLKMPSPVECECLRHIVEIIFQLADFERYSQDCVSTGPADAALHRQLSRTSGAARALFEQALQRVVDDEALELGDGSGR